MAPRRALNPGIRTGRHVTHDDPRAHSAFVTKCRKDVFDDTTPKRREKATREACDNVETGPWEYDAQADHVRLLVRCPPKTPLEADQQPRGRQLAAPARKVV
ncbi:transposase [Kitasatospora sp. NPDC058046]|uniref:transposase n=1 Tax=Kitasatospora sp. NPDC058046 TaxID=3346312 RepID=UPI0036DD88CB